MLMSMFSSFDALSAESLGQKLSFSSAPGIKKEAMQPGSSPQASDRKTGAVDSGNKGKDGNATLPTLPAKEPEDHKHLPLRQQRRPRFAVEFDGVHCFESIIPY